MRQKEVVELMQSSGSKEEWRMNCDTVQAAFGGDYPEFWYGAIIQSGLAHKTLERLGKSADTRFVVYSRRPLPSFDSWSGRPTSMPYIRTGERVVGIYDQGHGAKARVCNTLTDMQTLHDWYAEGMALSLKWAVENVQK